MRSGVRPSTRSTYEAGALRFVRFCDQYKLTPQPASEETILRFIAFLHLQQLAPSTVRVYLAAVRSLHINSGYPPPPTDKPRILKAIRAMEITSEGPKTKLPITLDILQKLGTVVPPFASGGCMWPAMTLAFFGCLRAAEFTVTKGIFSAGKHLCVGDIELKRSPEGTVCLALQLRHSKTDHYNHGCVITIGCSGNDICCPCVLQDYLAYRKLQGSCLSSSPLFVHHGKALSKMSFVNDTRLYLALIGLQGPAFSGHSYRSGSATSAAMAGFQDWEIKLMGRWTSSAYQRYIRAPQSLLANFAHRLCVRKPEDLSFRTPFVSNVFK